MKDSPAVTVLMSVYNGERFVPEAIQSILQQTWTDFEFLIINDGSTDRTREIISSFHDPRLRILDQPTNTGLTRSLNLGLKAARAPLVARQDADDRSHPERLRMQVEFMHANPQVALLGTQVRILNKRGRLSHRPGWQRAVNDTAIRFQSLFDNPFIHTSVMFRRDIVLDELGGFAETFPTAQDFELWSRISARHQVCNLPARLIDYRFHGSSTSAGYDDRHLERSSLIVAGNLRRYLGLHEVPERWLQLISTLHVNPNGVSNDELRELLNVIEAIYEQFVDRYPHEQQNEEVRRVLAAKISQIACLMATRKRASALSTFRRGCRVHARVGQSFAFKFFALLLLGQRLRSQLSR
ncbi:MAG TPA: glycosyltransferase [Pyrinomonadaceae bacterium]|nr:glycosyltransferase [Pyrinomonadaceae bacterium]